MDIRAMGCEEMAEVFESAHVAAGGPRDWVHHVINLLDTAARDLTSHQGAQRAIFEARGVLRMQIDLRAAVTDAKGGLLAWQAHRVRAYIDAHIGGPVLIADLCALVQRSEAHFARSFKRTFGQSPHAFLIRRRVELAAHYMLVTAASLSDIAARCGFTDQAHLCKHFRHSMGQTPAAWRRARVTIRKLPWMSRSPQRGIRLGTRMAQGAAVQGIARDHHAPQRTEDA